MKEALIGGAAVFLLSYLFVTAFIKISEAIDRYKMKKKTDRIKVGQRYESRTYFMNPFERRKYIVRILDIEEGYALYKYENGSGTLYSIELEDIVRGYILITDSNKAGYHGRNCN